EKYKKLLEVTDLVMLDIKEFDADAHNELTGHTNENIIEFAHYLSNIGKPMWIRHVLVPGVTGSDESLSKIKGLVDSLKTVEKIELLPYHSFGKQKWEKLGLDYSLKDVKPPSEEEVAHAKSILYL
ncbi:MAG: pyruvate formate lyase 1-activating protein, partial [Clostridia bacterium]|nr:pyruvate formate lyase 1-activating protein [Clostridia bacterium]